MIEIATKTIRFLVRLNENCRRRHTHTHQGHKVLNFSVQLEIHVKNKWYPAVRYDTAHGFAHRDYIHPDGRVDKTSLFSQDYNEALIFAEDDLKSNWEIYVAKFLKEVPHDG